MERRVRTLAVALLALVALAGVGLAITGGVGVSGTVTINAPSGPSVDVVTNGGELLLDGPAGPNTVVVTHDNGELVFESTGPTQATVDTTEIVGSYTSVSGIDASNDLTITPEDKPGVIVGGGVGSVEFGAMSVDDGSRDFSYSASSSASVTVNEIGAASETVIAVASDGTVLDQTTADSSGTATFSSLDAGSYDIQLATTSAPVVDDGSASPSGGETVSQTPVDLSINVSDADFPDSHGDNVKVTFVDEDTGDTIGSDTLTANGTATVSYDPSGGENNWSVVATDAYGNSVSSSTFTFQGPDELVVRNEKNPDEVLTNVNVRITAYYGDETLRRSTSNGRIDLSGFPIDQPVIVRASADGYVTRTAVVESIIQQSSIYLLNESTTTHDVRFKLQDPSGQYTTDDTVLFVERDLELNGSVEWRTIAGDNFGVQGTPVTLASGERYQLRIRNLETGQTAVIGAYTTIQSETVSISPGSATIEIVESNREYGWSAMENETGQYALFKYYDDSGQTDSLTLTIHERFNKSNVLVDNVTFSDANNIVYQKPMTAQQTNKTWMAEISVERGGQSLQFREPLSGPRNDIIPGNLGDGWRTGIGVIVLFATGMMFTSLNRSAGAIATALIGGLLWQVGLLSRTTTGPSVVLAIAISVIYHYRGGEV